MRLIGEAGAMKRFVEKIARAVAREHPAGAVGAMGGGGQAENQQLCVRVAEAGDGLAPVVPVAVGESLFGRDRFAIFNEARAFAAGDDLAIELIELAGRGHRSSAGETRRSWVVFNGLQRSRSGFLVESECPPESRHSGAPRVGPEAFDPSAGAVFFRDSCVALIYFPKPCGFLCL